MKVARFRLSRLQVATFALALSFMPWLRGGRDAAGLLVIYSCLLIGFILALRLLENRNYLVSKLALWATALGVYGGLSIFWSVNRYQSVVWLFGFTLAILAATLAHTLSKSKDGWAVFRRCYLEISAITSLIGIWLFVTASYDRLTSLFFWANPAATFLLPAVFISLWRFVKNRTFYDGLLAMVITTAFILTFSRAAGLVFVVVLISFMAYEKLKEADWINLVFIGILIFAAASFVGWSRRHVQHDAAISQIARYSEAIKGESTSLSDRLYYLRSTLAIWASEPLFGTGAGTFATMHPQYQYRVISAGSNAHNVYLQWASELGVVGVLLLVGMMFELLVGLYRRLRRTPGLSAAVFGLVAMLLHLGLDIGASFPADLILVAVLIGYLYMPGPPGRLLTIKSHIHWPVAAAFAFSLLPLLGYYKSLDYTASAIAAQDNSDLTQAAGEFEAAHLELVYNPDTFTGEGINEYTMATAGYEPQLNLIFARMRAESAIAKDEFDAQHWFLLGRIARAQGDVVNATHAYLHALELDTFNHPLYYSDLTQYYLTRREFGLAISLATNGLNLYTPEVIENRAHDENLPSEVANLYIARANAYIQANHIDLARRDIASALKTDRANTSAKRLEATLPPNEEQQYLPTGAGQSLKY